MPSSVESRVASCCRRLLTFIFAALLLPAYAAAAGACGQADTASLSDAARAILEMNQNLSGGLTARVAGLHTSERWSSTGTLQNRAQLIRELMQTHPEEVRSVMLTAGVAARLLAADPANAAYVEHDAALTGNVAAIELDDFEHGAAQRVYVLHDPSTGLQIAIHPATSFGLQTWLHRSVAISGVRLGADLLGEAIRPATTFATRTDTPQSLALGAAAVPASNTTLTCSTMGQQRTAVLLLQFPNNTPAFPGSYGTSAWWQQAITGSGNSVNSMWSEMTAGATYATVDVYGPLRLSQSYGCADYLQMRSAALTLAANTIDLSKYTRIVLGFPESRCSFGGLADIGCNSADSIVTHPYSVVWMPIVTSYTASTGVWGSLTHELGHNLGLHHANTLDFGGVSLGPIDFQATNPGTVGGTGATTATGSVIAVDTEYGDLFSVMGSPWSAGPGPYSAEHRARLLGWVPANDPASGLGTVTSAGSYTLQPASNGTGLRALRVLRDATSASWIWLEYRNGGTPFDAGNLAAVQGENVPQGAVVHYENGYGDHDKTYQLDMTPIGKGNNFADGALTQGTSWSDPYSPLSLTVNNITSAGLNVSVRYDSTCATFSFGGTPVNATGGTGTVAVTAPSTCSWKASSNAAWMTLGGTTTGTGNGSFTWTAAANTGSGQRVTYLTVGRVSQRLVQLGSSVNVIALSPANVTVNPGSSIALSLTLADASGISDVQTVELDARAAGAPTCTVVAAFSSGTPQFFVLDPLSDEFSNGIASGGAGSVGSSACSISGNGSGIAIDGSSNLTLTLNLTFPAASPGVRGLFATANSGTELPVGVLHVGTVTATQTNPTTTQPVTSQATLTALTATPSAPTPGAAIVLGTAVAAVSGSTVPTGTVAFMDGAATLGSVTLVNTGKASLSLTTLSNGTHHITALYSGDSIFAASASPAVSVTVAPAATTATLTGSAANVLAGGSATLTVNIGHTAGPFTPSGTVTLRDGSAPLTVATLNNGTASFPVSAIPAGRHTYTAAYSGDTTYLGSTSNAIVIEAATAPTTLSLASTPTVLAGTAVTITVNATGGTTGSAAPTGTVLLQDGDHSLGTVMLSSGTGTLAIGNLATGAHSITASYAGDSNFSAAASAAIAVNVVDFTIAAPPGTQTGIAVTAGALAGNSATLTITPASGGFPLSVALVCNGAPTGATCTVTPGAVTPGSTTVPVTVTVVTTARSASQYVAALGAWLALPLLGFVRRAQRLHPALRVFTMLLAALAVSAGLTGCGNGTSGAPAATTSSSPSSPASGTPAGNSALTVQAVAVSNGATLTHSITLNLQVN